MNAKEWLFSMDTRGNEPLWKVFWLYGVLLSHLYFGVLLFVFDSASPLIMALLLAGFVVYTLGIMRAIWINAFNTSKEIHTFLARYLTVFWMINSLLVTFYLSMVYFGFWTIPEVDGIRTLLPN
jgi:hypothetical protein